MGRSHSRYVVKRKVLLPVVRRALRRFLWPLVFFTDLHASSARQDWIFDIRSGVLYNSNVSNSDRSADVRQDEAWRSVLSAGQGFQLNDDLRLSIFAEMDSEVWRTYVGLTNTRPGLSTNLRYRFGLGKDAPWIRLESKLAYADFNEARRSGWDVRPGLRGGVSLTERVRLEAAYEYEHFDARDVVFQHDGHTVAFHGKIDLTASTRLVIGYTYRHGDVTSAATPPRPDIIKIAADLDEPIRTFGEPYVAYRFEASTHAGSIAINQALTNSVALQASYEYRYTTHDPLHYINHVAELALAVSF